MRKIIIFISLVYSSSFAAQTDNVVDQTFYVNGKCDMCETRIENMLDVKGIKIADWNVETKMCRVVYRKDKISEKEIHQLLAKGGHDTKIMRSTDEDYNKLHHCCRYKRD
jgi:arsenate reductase-like glutaredoxin family protein